MRTVRKSILALAALALTIPIGAAGAGILDRGVPEHLGPGEPGIEQVGDIEHVASLSYSGGSDIEFASREVIKLSEGATGDPVCVESEPGLCLEDEEGNIVWETEVRDFAVVGRLGSNAWVVDITDPRNPVKASEVPCAINQNDIQIQGDLLLAASDGNGSCRLPDGGLQSFAGTAVLDFSDPRNPTYLSRLQYGRGSHNHTFVPGQPIVYLSDSDVASAGLGNVPIWDVSDPETPVMRNEFKFGAHSPHDITFNAEGTRAYVAAVTLTYILNTEDPINPELLSVIPNEGISISHQSDPTPDGDYLLVTDELGGGAAGLSPGGAVHMYDIRNEERPVKVGLLWDDCVLVSCENAAAEVPISTAHVFRINPDGYTMAIAWYKDGVHVFDYSDIRGATAAGSGAATSIGMRTIGRMRLPNANTWAAKMWQERHPGYVFANDINRGLDIFYVSSMGPGFLARGTIRGGHPGNEVGVGVTRTEFESDCEYTPRTNGVDGWVAEIPDHLADGTTALAASAVGSVTGVYDLDMYFYNESCGLLSAVENIGTDESGMIPAETAYVMVTNWVGEPVVVQLTTQEDGA
jgi:hypothetical protein